MPVAISVLNRKIKTFKNRAEFQIISERTASIVKKFIVKETSFIGRDENEAFLSGIKSLTKEIEEQGQLIFGEGVFVIDDSIDRVEGDDYTLTSNDIERDVISQTLDNQDNVVTIGYTWSWQNSGDAIYTGDDVVASVGAKPSISAIDSDQTFFPFIYVSAGSPESLSNVLEDFEGRSILSALSPQDYEPRNGISYPEGKEPILQEISPFILTGS